MRYCLRKALGMSPDALYVQNPDRNVFGNKNQIDNLDGVSDGSTVNLACMEQEGWQVGRIESMEMLLLLLLRREEGVNGCGHPF